MKNRSPKRLTFSFAGRAIIAGSTILTIIALTVFYGIIPYIIKFSVLEEIELREGSDIWGKWTDIKIPVFIKIYIFNVTNVEEAEKGGRFHVKDIGPYVWEEKRTKDIISIDEIEDTVAYTEEIRYFFRPDLSVGSQEDTLNIVNVPFLSAATLAYKTVYTTWANNLVDVFMETGEKFVIRNVKVRELVFDGVELGVIYGALTDFGIVNLPQEFIDGTFAIYNRRNATPSKEFKMYRGIKNYQDFGQIVEYDEKKEVNFWTNQTIPSTYKHCNKIKGSDGSLVPPFVNKNERIYIFAPDICRSIYLSFAQEINFEGVPSYQFSLPVSALSNTKEENRCFCSDPRNELENQCKNDVALKLFPCKKGIPIGLSLPHFLHEEKSFHDGVDGLEPNQSLHEGGLVVEPNSGAVLKIDIKLQVSVELAPIPGIQAFSHVKYAAVPFFWVDEMAEYDEDSLEEIRLRLVTRLELIRILKIVIFTFLTLSILSGMLLYYWRKSIQQPLLDQLNKDARL